MNSTPEVKKDPQIALLQAEKKIRELELQLVELDSQTRTDREDAEALRQKAASCVAEAETLRVRVVDLQGKLVNAQGRADFNADQLEEAEEEAEKAARLNVSLSAEVRTLKQRLSVVSAPPAPETLQQQGTDSRLRLRWILVGGIVVGLIAVLLVVVLQVLPAFSRDDVEVAAKNPVATITKQTAKPEPAKRAQQAVATPALAPSNSCQYGSFRVCVESVDQDMRMQWGPDQIYPAEQARRNAEDACRQAGCIP